MYTPPDESKNPSPLLTQGDPEGKKEFALKYTKYAAKHKSDQRSIPPAHRMLPKAVVECIEPGLLIQICRLELPKKYRTRKPEEVSAMAVHRWVMGATKLPIDVEDSEGVSKMRALKCTINATEGLSNVQQLFMKVFEYQTTYHMRTSEKEIIKWLSSGIKPPRVKHTVMNALRVEGKKGRARRKRLTTFHRLLKRLATKFDEAQTMGLGGEEPKAAPNKIPKKTGGDFKPRNPTPTARNPKTLNPRTKGHSNVTIAGEGTKCTSVLPAQRPRRPGSHHSGGQNRKPPRKTKKELVPILTPGVGVEKNR